MQFICCFSFSFLILRSDAILCPLVQHNFGPLGEKTQNLTCATNEENALVLSLPAEGEWYRVTHSFSKNSVLSCSSGGSSNSLAWEIPECIIDVGPPEARSSRPPSFCCLMASISEESLKKVIVNQIFFSPIWIWGITSIITAIDKIWRSHLYLSPVDRLWIWTHNLGGHSQVIIC